MSSVPPPAYQQPAQPPQPDAEPPIWAPWYGIGFVGAIKRFFKKYADFTGRASRSEFWWFYLAYAIVATILSIILISALAASIGPQIADSTNADGTISSGAQLSYPIGAIIAQIVLGVIGLAILVPTLAVIVRRLHDGNFGWGFIFFLFIPIVLLILLIMPSNPQGQQYDRPRA